MENIPLSIGIIAAVLVGFWVLKKIFKLALYAAIVGAGAWIWYFYAR